MQYFLLKTEPSSYSIDDLKRDKKTSWGGVRNFQARNIIRDHMKKGDLCIIYHSSTAEPAAVGVGEVAGAPYPDPLQFESKSEYYDPTSKITDPRWYAVDVTFVRKFLKPITLKDMRVKKEFSDMRLLAKGNRLSVMEIAKKHFEFLEKLSQ